MVPVGSPEDLDIEQEMIIDQEELYDSMKVLRMNLCLKPSAVSG